MPPGTYLIGIAGPSGAGKTYLATHLAAAMGAKVLGLDHYYRDLSHLSLEERALANFDDPQALERELLVEQVACLRKGETVALPRYDFATHTRAQATEILEPSPVLIVEGLFAIYWPELRELLCTKVYVDMNDEVCLTRRMHRDVSERGRTADSVLQQYRNTVAPMAEQYVRPCVAHADVVVFGADPIEEEVERVLAHYQGHVARVGMSER
jgi:uridine kinase